MARATREMHDICLAACRSLKAADPALDARAMDRAYPPAAGTPEHERMLDVLALNGVASGWAASTSVPECDMVRAAAVLVRLGVRP